MKISTLAANPITFIQQLSAKHQVRVDVFDAALFVQRGSALRIIGITQVFEGFLDDVIENHPKIKTREGRKKNETFLDFILRKLDLPIQTSKTFITSLDYKLWTYYRQVRNGIAHKRNRSQAPESSDSLIALRRAAELDERYVRLAAPNDSHCLTFDDYVLCSRAAKAVAAQLCEISGLSEEEIATWIEKKRHKSGTVARQANNVRTLLRVTFGLNSDTAQRFVVNLGLVGQ